MMVSPLFLHDLLPLQNFLLTLLLLVGLAPLFLNMHWNTGTKQALTAELLETTLWP
jgi:hypothetical protein